MSPKNLSREELERIYETKTFLLNNLNRKFTAARLARHAAMNMEKFREVFCYVFGYRVAEYILEARMQLGYFLLRHTGKTIKEIATLSGYRYSKNFMLAFKKHFGITAGAVRIQNQAVHCKDNRDIGSHS